MRVDIVCNNNKKTFCCCILISKNFTFHFLKNALFKCFQILQVIWCYVKRGMASFRCYGNLDLGEMNLTSFFSTTVTLDIPIASIMVVL